MSTEPRYRNVGQREFYRRIKGRQLRVENGGSIYSVRTTSYYEGDTLIAKSFHGMGRPAFYVESANGKDVMSAACVCEACRGRIPNEELRSVTGTEIRTMLRKHRLTIRAVANRTGLTMKHVRDRRQHGGPWDWPLLVGQMVRERACGRCGGTTLGMAQHVGLRPCNCLRGELHLIPS